MGKLPPVIVVTGPADIGGAARSLDGPAARSAAL